MRLPAVIAALTIASSALPCLAQGLDATGGANVPIEKYAATARVDEGVALVEIDETFRNPTAAQTEGVWRFRLPADAVVSSFSMWMNGIEKQGRVLEAQTARRVYDSIVRTRKDPGLLEQTGWRQFQVSVFPIPANDTVRIRLRYAYVLPDELGLESLEVPLPVGCGPVGDLRVSATFTAARGLASLDCPSHPGAKVAFEKGRGEASWSADGVAAERPFVVRALPKRDGFDVAVVATRPPEGGDGWFVARVVPRLAEPPKIPRDVVFVIDRSGSMEGVKMSQARAALLRGLATLSPGDRFGVVSFSTDVASIGDALLSADAANLERARAAANELSASGGTNISAALEAALALRSADATRLFAVVFLTDGMPTVGETNADRILAAWRAKNAGAARLFAFGVGADVKDFLLTKLAADGRGSATYVTSDADLEVKIAALVDSIRTPLLVDPEIAVLGDGVKVLDREPSRLPDVFQGRALVVSGRFSGTGRATLRLRGRADAAAGIDVQVPLDFTAAQDLPHVAQIWARQRVEHLLDDLRQSGANAEIRAEIVRLGVRFQVVSPYTSFLVVEDGVRIPDASEEARVPDAPGGPATGGGGGGGAPSTGGGFSKRSSSGGGGGGSGRGGPPEPTSGGYGFGGPLGEVPPDTREPSDPPPPPEGGEPQSPGGESQSGPSMGGPDAGGPTTPSGSGTSAGRSAGGVRRVGLEDWTYWWRFAWDDLLASAPTAARVSPSPETLATLRAMLADPTESSHTRSRAALALAAMDDEASVPVILEIASAPLGRDHPALAERSVLALGLVRYPTPEIRAVLLRTLRDTTRTRDFGRAYAAVALGMLPPDPSAPTEIPDALAAVARERQTSDANVGPACLVALGQCGGEPSIQELVRVLRSRDEALDAFAVFALGRIGRPAPGVVDALIEALGAKSKAGENARRSVPAALARIATNSTPDGQRRIVAALSDLVRDTGDVTLVGRAIVALGRIAGDTATNADVRVAALQALDRASNLKSPSARAYAAIGFGLALHAEPCGVRAKDAEFVRKRLAALAGQDDVRVQTAACLATGLAGDGSATYAMDLIVADAGRGPAARSGALVASALLGSFRAPDAITAALGDPAMRDAAVQAAAVHGGDAARRLATSLTDPHIPSNLGLAIVRALGRHRDAATVDALRRVADDPQAVHPDLTRSWAVLAIGRICGDFAPLDRATEDLEFRAYVPALAELLGGM